MSKGNIRTDPNQRHSLALLTVWSVVYEHCHLHLFEKRQTVKESAEPGGSVSKDFADRSKLRNI